MRNQVHDVRVAFHDHELLDLYRALRGDASDVVASEVDEHDMFGAFLLAVEHVGGEPDVLLFRFAARTGSRDRADRSGASGELDELFRGGADEGASAEFCEEGVGRGVDQTQCAVELERACGRFGGELLRHDNLNAFAFIDRLFCRFDFLFEFLAGHFWLEGLHRTRLFFPDIGLRNMGVQALVKLFDFLNRAVVSFAERHEFTGFCADRDDDGVADVVEDDHFIGEHEAEKRCVLFKFELYGRFELADCIVCDISDCAAGQRGKIGRLNEFVRVEDLLELGEPVRSGKFGASFFLVLNDHSVGQFHEDRVGVDSDEGVARPAFGTFDGFEEEDLFVVFELVEDRDGCFHVREEFAVDRYDGTGFAAFRERFEIKFFQHFCTPSRVCFYVQVCFSPQKKTAD